MISAIWMPASAPLPAREGDCPMGEIWSSLTHLEATYPGFGQWLGGTVEPGLLLGSRRVFVRRSGSVLDGVVIAKREPAERKLCTIWTAPHARSSGVASGLVEEAIDWLEDPAPLLTMPEERMTEFRGLIAAFGFEPTEVLRSYYREGKSEFVFNGRLRRRPDC